MILMRFSDKLFARFAATPTPLSLAQFSSLLASYFIIPCLIYPTSRHEPIRAQWRRRSGLFASDDDAVLALLSSLSSSYRAFTGPPARLMIVRSPRGDVSPTRVAPLPSSRLPPRRAIALEMMCRCSRSKIHGASFGRNTLRARRYFGVSFIRLNSRRFRPSVSRH